MTAALPPLLLRPHYVPKPWGGRRLAEDLGRCDLPAGPIGESWEVYDLGAQGGSVVDGGPHDGARLRDVLGVPVPLLLKVLDARADLSVQVHPDARDGAEAKEEAWVALRDGACVAVERAGATRVAAAAPEGGWLDHLPQRTMTAGCPHTPRPPDMVHVPPGTVHAILAGSLVFEVQNPVDVTWRLDDHGRTDAAGRARALHLDEARGVLGRPTPAPAPLRADGCRLEGERFSIDLLGPGPHTAVGAGALFFTCAGTIRHGRGESLAVPAGRTVWLPAPVEALESAGWVVAATPR